jgi:hypothetical protein
LEGLPSRGRLSRHAHESAVSGFVEKDRPATPTEEEMLRTHDISMERRSAAPYWSSIGVARRNEGASPIGTTTNRSQSMSLPLGLAVLAGLVWGVLLPLALVSALT